MSPELFSQGNWRQGEHTRASAAPSPILLVPDPTALLQVWAEGLEDQLASLFQRHGSIVLIDEALEALSQRSDSKHALELTAYIRSNAAFVVHITEVGAQARELRAQGQTPKPNSPQLAIAEFMSAGHGLKAYLKAGDLVWMLVEHEQAWVVFNAPGHLRVVGVESLLEGLKQLDARG
jgi:hypothetical protein